MTRTICGLQIGSDGRAYFEDGLFEERWAHNGIFCLSCEMIANGRGRVHAGNLAGFALGEDDLNEQETGAFLAAARRVLSATIKHEQSEQAKLFLWE